MRSGPVRHRLPALGQAWSSLVLAVMCWSKTESGQRVICHPRGKKSQAVVGDRILWQPSHDEGTIEKMQERRNLFYRQDEMRTKSFAANLDQVLMLVAADPEFSESQLARALIAAEAERIEPMIVLNKSDLVEPFDRAWARLAPYRAMGYGVLPLSLQGARTCRPRRRLLQHAGTARPRWCSGPRARAKAR